MVKPQIYNCVHQIADPKETFITSVPNEVAMVEQDKQPVVMDVPPRTTFAVRNILTSDEATHMASAVHEFFKLASQGNEESVRTQKEQLFGEIATSYVYSLLKLETRHWDEFRTMLPSLLTNTALGSDGQRDETRKQAIYDTICYWIHGTQPSLPLDATWPSTPPSDDLARSASQDWLVPATDAPSRGGGDTTARPSAYLFHIPQARPTSFALTQPSPLLRYIISPPSRLVTIHRSTLVRSSLIPPSDVTYHDIVAESLTRCKRVAKQTQKANEELVRDRNRTKRELDREINKEWKEVRGILCRPDLVKSAADKILQRVQEPEKAPVQPGSQAVSRRR
ncbi:hypothetical protein BC832DRAFT_384808 [Gaertneriomyces semiglobifer]|nr:hypothetical protein BC832DRAFT_384808 [Gaertneriomyces semiglobifer]